MTGFAAILGPHDPAVATRIARALEFRGNAGVLTCDAPMLGGQRAEGRGQKKDAGSSALRPLPSGLSMVGHVRVDGDVLELYRKHRERCVEHLRGDFAFALWDGERLFCARDHFGVRPLYYARHGDALIVTNTLPALLEVVPRDLDDEALAEFLLHDMTVDVHRTTYAKIARVPPAHRLIATRDSLRVERYWSFPLRETPLRIDEREAAGEFRRHLTNAVRDRAQGREVVLSMSGGIDSTAVAAALVNSGIKVRALTSVWDRLIPDREREAAGNAARALGIPIEFQVCDDYEPFVRWNEPAVRGFEPNREPYSAAFIDLMAMAAARGPVLLGGWGGDPSMATSGSYFFDLLRRGRWLRFLTDATHFGVARHRWPPLLLRSRLYRAVGLHRKRDTAPEWLLPHLRERWREPVPSMDPRTHPWRPEAFRAIMLGVWPSAFESYDAGATLQPIEYAAPFFDVRLLEFVFSLPPMPHFAGKDLLRESMRGWLPDAVRLRPKMRLRGDPLAVVWPRSPERWVEIVDHSPGLERFVRRPILRNELRRGLTSELRAQANAVALGCWLSSAGT